MTVLAGGQGGSGYAEGLGGALGQRALGLRHRALAVLAGGQGGSGYAEGLADALGQRTLALRNRSLALVVTAASWVETASAAAVALGWLPMFFSVICSLTRAELSAALWG